MTDPKPCPFCGGKAEVVTQNLNGQRVTWVQCMDRKCGASALPASWERRA